jgi:hypothetical protein
LPKLLQDYKEAIVKIMRHQHLEKPVKKKAQTTAKARQVRNQEVRNQDLSAFLSKAKGREHDRLRPRAKKELALECDPVLVCDFMMMQLLLMMIMMCACMSFLLALICLAV